MKRIIYSLVLLLSLPLLCQAALDLQLTKGIKARVPIAVVPFAWSGEQQARPPVKVGEVITDDLRNSGHFELPSVDAMQQLPHQVSQINFPYWQKLGVSALLVGQVQSQGQGQYHISVSLVNLFKDKHTVVPQSAEAAAFNPKNNPILFHQTYTVSKQHLRQVAHQIANRIYKEMLGLPGYFTTHIAYIAVARAPVKGLERYNLMVADYDGYGAKALLSSDQPLAAPAWSPNGKDLAYVSYENNDQPAIYEMNVTTKRRKLLADFSGGVNDQPAWAPDGKSLTLVLAKTGVPKVYSLNLLSGKLTQLTKGWGVDTDPAWMPNGQSLLFVSNRSGSPQVYRYNVESKQVQKLTYNGVYNASPSIAQDGSTIALLHGAGGIYNIALLDLKQGQFQVLTHSGLASSPSVSPQGSLIVYSTYLAGHENLAMVSQDGLIQFYLPDPLKLDERQPAWSGLK